MLMLNDILQRWEPRFDYWCEFSQKEFGFVSKCHDWWMSRFGEEHREEQVFLFLRSDDVWSWMSEKLGLTRQLTPNEADRADRPDGKRSVANNQMSLPGF